MFPRRRPQSDFSAELQAHLDLEQDRLLAEGMPLEEARRQARKNLGNLLGAKERFYESSRWMWLEQIWQDTRLTFRHLRTAPAFAVTAILTLGLGIGATTSIFTLVHAVMLKSLPVSNPDQLYRLGNETHCCVWGGYGQGREFSIVSWELYQHLRRNAAGFEELAAFQAGDRFLGVQRAGSANPAESYQGEFVSGNYFATFGVGAYAGRILTADDDSPAATPVAVMSYSAWQRKFGLDPDVVGGAFQINGKPFTVAGIAPPGFFGDKLSSAPPDFFLPLSTEPYVQGDSSMLDQPNRHWLALIGRVRPGFNVLAMETQMRVALQHWLQSHLADMSPNEKTRLAQQTLYLRPGGAGITGMREQYEQRLQILMMVAGFVLLIVCANVANLLLVRGMERRQQTSLSMALGARPARLIRQGLTESIVLSLLGGAAGVGIAFAGTRLLLSLAMAAADRMPIEASPSLPVLLFAFGVSLATGIVFGIAPAWMAMRADPIEALRGANRTTRRAGSLPRMTLAILQAALSLVLLSAAGLLTQALHKLERQDFGFEQADRYVINIDPLLAGYKPAELEPLYRRIRESLGGIPGVASVALTLYSPMGGDSWNELIFVDGRSAPTPADNNISWVNRVSPEYFATIGTPIVKGRGITEADRRGSRHVAVVNEAFARQFFKDEDPIGRHFGSGDPRISGEFEIVGVARDSRYLTYGLSEPVGPFYFLPEGQVTEHLLPANRTGEIRSQYLHDIVVRVHPGGRLTEEQARRALAAVDSRLPMMLMRTMTDQVSSVFGQQRLMARLTSLFGMLALVLAAIGIYGVTAYSVGSRTNEIGLRMALGADRGNVLALILRGAMTLIAIGLAAGIPLSLGAGQLIRTQLYGVNERNPAVILLAVAALGLAGLLAALIPALRASRISPLEALRAE